MLVIIMSTAVIGRYQLRFDSELCAHDDTKIGTVTGSGNAFVRHRILGYYTRPTTSSHIRVAFHCDHPAGGPMCYRGDNGTPTQLWDGEVEIDAALRRLSAIPALRQIVATQHPPVVAGGIINCGFTVQERWSRELSRWVPIDLIYSASCVLRYRVKP